MLVRSIALTDHHDPVRSGLGLLTWWAMGLAIFLAGAGGCSSESNEAAPLGGEVSEFCAGYAAVLCEAQLSCGCFEPGAAELCRGLEQQRCAAAAGDSVDEGRQRFDPQAAAACLEEITPLFRACEISEEPDTTFCGGVFVGLMGEAGFCELDGDCSPGMTCETERCVSLPGANDRCDSERRCGPELVCVSVTGNAAEDGEDGEPICRPPARAHEPCAGEGQCVPADELHCDENSTCEPRLGPDSPCTSTKACQADLFCPEVPAHCEAAPAVGEPCAGDCAAGAYCDWDAPLEPTCVLRPALGESCSRADDSVCAGEADCLPQCTLRRALGGSCDGTTPLECGAALFCALTGVGPTGHQCQSRRILDDPCSGLPHECDDHFYCA